MGKQVVAHLDMSQNVSGELYINLMAKTPVNECIKKWKGLRDTYRKNRKKEKERRRSGAGAGGGKPWKYARIMAFIDPFMEDRHSQTNMAGPVSEGESEEDTDQAAPGRATVEDQEAPVDNQAAPGRAPVEDQEAPGRAQAADQLAPQAEEQAAGKSRRKTGRGRDQTRDALDAERLTTAIEAVSCLLRLERI
ncbi:unnamed protein product [Gadus morhua 'NCC']